MRDFPLNFGEQARGRNERQIVSAGLAGEDARESAAQMQRMDGMHIKTDFTSVQMRQTALEHIYGQSLVRQGPVPGGKDVIVDEDGRPERPTGEGYNGPNEIIDENN